MAYYNQIDDYGNGSYNPSAPQDFGMGSTPYSVQPTPQYTPPPAAPPPQAAPTQPPSYTPPPAPTPQQQSTYYGRNAQYADTISGWYQKYLGRAASPQEIQNRLNDPNFDINRHAADVMNSQEAQAYAAKTQPATPPASTTTTNGPTFQGQNAGWYSGFDTNKTYSKDSAKGTYFSLAQKSGINPGTLDKAGAEAWFKQYIMPGMNAAGFKVEQVNGDKAFIRTTETPQGAWVDFVKGAGSSDPSNKAYHWGGGITPGTAAYQGGSGGGTASAGVGQALAGASAASMGSPAIGGSSTGTAGGTGIAGAESALLLELLNNPYSLSPEVIAQIKARFQDQNAVGVQQLGQQINQNAASRGMVGSGATEAALRRSGEAGYSALLGNNREVDIAAAEQRTQDILAALGAGNDFMTREGGFAIDREGMSLQRYLADMARRENARQFDLGLGFDYTALDVNGNANLFNALYG